MTLAETTVLMLSKDIKERLTGEYYQNALRCRSLKIAIMHKKQESTLFRYTTPISLLEEQLECMEKLDAILKYRCKAEGILLKDATENATE